MIAQAGGESAWTAPPCRPLSVHGWKIIGRWQTALDVGKRRLPIRVSELLGGDDQSF